MNTPRTAIALVAIFCGCGSAPDDSALLPASTPIDPDSDSDPDSGPPCLVTVYAESEFEGNQACLTTGTFTRQDLDAMGFAETSIGSVTLDSGYRLTVITDSGGRYETAAADAKVSLSMLPGKVSSMMVDECGAGFFEDREGHRAGTCLGAGTYDAKALAASGLRPGQTRSVSVAPGYSLTLERSDGTTTTTDVLDANSEELSFEGKTILSAKLVAQDPMKEPAVDSQEAEADERGSGINLGNAKHLFILGDSLSDQHNAYGNIHFLWCPNPHYGYWNGRFTNGRNWVDYLLEDNPQLKSVHNKAVGGSKVLKSHLWRPNLEQQAQKIVASKTKHELQDSIVIVWSGSNDLHNEARSSNWTEGKPAKHHGFGFGVKVGEKIAVIVRNLHEKHHVGHVLIADMPPLNLIPMVRTDAEFTNDLLGKARVQFLEESVRGTDFIIDLAARVHRSWAHRVPVNGFVSDFLTGRVGPEPFDQEGLRRPCQVLGGLNACAVSLRHGYDDKACPKKMFMDQLHPTSAAHCGVENVFLSTMVEAGYTDVRFGDCKRKDRLPGNHD
jgi:hypothetical protein